MRIPAILLLAAGLTIALVPAAMAADPAAIADKAGCMKCHATNDKMFGPAYHAVAAKYAKDAGAPARLAQAVRAGSKGTWGPMPMPPTDAKKVSDADLAAVVAWILKQ